MYTRDDVRRIRQNVFDGFKEGWSYITSFIPLRAILSLVGFISLVAMPYSVLLPVFATKILQGGPHTLGFLTGATGLGALASAMTLAMRRTIVGLGRMINVMTFTFGGGLIAFAFSRTPWLSYPLMFVVGFSMMGLLAASNTIMQTIVDEDKRGRVMAFYTLSFTGVMPFGSLIAGTLASRIGAPLTVVCGGTLCLIAAIWFSTRLPEVRRIVRPIYVELGILPEVATGIQAASALQTPPEVVD
jgi:MFS family permease